MHLIDDQESLDAFRSDWGAAAILELLMRYPLLFINWAVGVGKSFLMDDLIELAVFEGLYDLLLVMVPTRKVLEERRWILNSPPGIKVINLKPRPVNLCGPSLDAQLSGFERRGMALFGKTMICGKVCQNRATCFWHGQYGKTAMDGAKVIYGTQAHLERDPMFVSRVQDWAGAKKPLLLLDEANFIAKSRRVVISKEDLMRYKRVLDRVDGQA